jgi:hypothetical protein
MCNGNGRGESICCNDLIDEEEIGIDDMIFLRMIDIDGDRNDNDDMDMFGRYIGNGGK